MRQMMRHALGTVVCTAVMALAGAAGAAAEARVDAKADWSVFKASSGARECWIVSAPTASSARRDGREVTVQRSDILLMVTVRPGDNVTSEFSFSAGYPLRAGSKVSVKVGGESQDMFVDGEWGWLNSPAEDDRLAATMKRGAVATVTGVSQRGTTTTDTFSLKGFTAALEAAQDLCK